MTASYYRYWGKARPSGEHGAQYHLLPYHCLDVAAVGVEYLRRAPAVARLLVGGLHARNAVAIENWVSFWLALHDLGKFSEAFQSQKPELFEALRVRLPNSAKTYRLRHDSLGALFWKDVLCERAEQEQWFGPATAEVADGIDCWIRAVTGHHGQPPEAGGYWDQHFDRREDCAAIFPFVADLRALLFDTDAAAIPSQAAPEEFHRVSQELSWWIAGIAVLADWLGSNTDYFPYRADPDAPMSLRDYWDLARQQAVTALDATGVLPVRCGRALSFAELFPHIAKPSPLQSWAAGVGIAEGPQLHLLEDVTGAGKTEAAVALAHRMMAAGQADGFFIGLPTMATANAMYDRIAQVYARLFSDRASLVLAHGSRNLVEAFADSVLPPGPRDADAQQADDSATARCTAWLADHNKRALLAAAGVGTIDQALLAVLHSRHQSLRLLGLFRKVLVVDEVHACDAYMLGVLKTLLEFHGRAGGSAILLSATLPLYMKQALLNAFARGCRSSAPAIREQAYPLVTVWRSASPQALDETVVQTRDDVRRRIAVRYVAEESQAVDVIDGALAAGQCVCWIRNTVADAVIAFDLFRPRLSADRLMLFHARYALKDRLDIEERVLAYFGPASGPADRAGRLLIATQVVEQSLDVDFDVVVSDLAPIDRLIQRAGRMRRHARDPVGRRLTESGARDQRGEACLGVFGPPWTQAPPEDWFKSAFPKTAGVYANHGQLWLTARALQEGSITMPADARRLIEGVFGDEGACPEGLRRTADAAEAESYADASVAQQNTLKLALGYERGGIDWWSEAKTPSRLGDASMNVLLGRWDGDRLQPWIAGPHGWAYSSVRVAERLIARTAEPPPRQRKAAVAQVMQMLPNKGQWSVLLPLDKTPQGWVGTAWSAPQRHGVGRELNWIYDVRTGLRQLANLAAQEDEE